MRTTTFKSILMLILFALPSLTFAGEIFGTIKKDGKAVAKQEVKIMQNGKEIAKAISDDNGYYSVNIKSIGKVSIELTGYAGATLEGFSTNNSSEYNLILTKTGDTWQLKKT
jgi:hypothetical protein